MRTRELQYYLYTTHYGDYKYLVRKSKIGSICRYYSSKDNRWYVINIDLSKPNVVRVSKIKAREIEPKAII